MGLVGRDHGERLAPALPQLLTALEAHDQLGMSPEVRDLLLAMSPATMDRHLKPYRNGLIATKGIAHTKPGTLLKSSIPLKTWAEWNDTEPGFIEIDLVGHEGGDNNGAFFYSLNATDIATGWTETCTVRSKGERIVAAGLDNLIGRFPFLILGIHPTTDPSSSITTSPATAHSARSPSPEDDQPTPTTKPTSSRRTGRSFAAPSATTATTPPANSASSTNSGQPGTTATTCSCHQ